MRRSERVSSAPRAGRFGQAGGEPSFFQPRLVQLERVLLSRLARRVSNRPTFTTNSPLTPSCWPSCHYTWFPPVGKCSFSVSRDTASISVSLSFHSRSRISFVFFEQRLS